MVRRSLPRGVGFSGCPSIRPRHSSGTPSRAPKNAGGDESNQHLTRNLSWPKATTVTARKSKNPRRKSRSPCRRGGVPDQFLADRSAPARVGRAGSCAGFPSGGRTAKQEAENGSLLLQAALQFGRGLRARASPGRTGGCGRKGLPAFVRGGLVSRGGGSGVGGGGADSSTAGRVTAVWSSAA